MIRGLNKFFLKMIILKIKLKLTKIEIKFELILIMKSMNF